MLGSQRNLVLSLYLARQIRICCSRRPTNPGTKTPTTHLTEIYKCSLFNKKRTTRTIFGAANPSEGVVMVAKYIYSANDDEGANDSTTDHPGATNPPPHQTFEMLGFHRKSLPRPYLVQRIRK